MTPLSTSFRALDRLHPVVAGIVMGAIAVTLYALVAPGGAPRADAWMLFLAVGIGGGIGRLVQARVRDARADGR